MPGLKHLVKATRESEMVKFATCVQVGIFFITVFEILKFITCNKYIIYNMLTGSNASYFTRILFYLNLLFK